jgi:hypothetical protein
VARALSEIYKCISRGQRAQKSKTAPNIRASITIKVEKKVSVTQSTADKSAKKVVNTRMVPHPRLTDKVMQSQKLA